jgi:hypothetical protein
MSLRLAFLPPQIGKAELTERIRSWLEGIKAFVEQR